ncbi:MAG: RluA family pseudouridine synthase [Rikenellaceae bacterium]
MFDKKDILYEDNHIMVVNKQAGDLVQVDNTGDISLEDAIKDYIKYRDNKQGNVYLGVVHRIDRPVSGAIVFAKTSKALTRLNEAVKKRDFKKIYWAVTEQRPNPESGSLTHYIVRNSKTNKSKAFDKEVKDSKLARLNYTFRAAGTKYSLIEVELLTGRHHQIRCQLSSMGCNIKGDLKYGAARSNPDGSISLHSRLLEFEHPVKKETITVTAPVPADNLWHFFEKSISD